MARKEENGNPRLPMPVSAIPIPDMKSVMPEVDVIMPSEHWNQKTSFRCSFAPNAGSHAEKLVSVSLAVFYACFRHGILDDHSSQTWNDVPCDLILLPLITKILCPRLNSLQSEICCHSR